MTNLLLIGHGNMGSALSSRWQALANITVVEPRDIAKSNITHVKSLAELPAGYAADVIVLAVKPQQIDIILPALQKRFGISALFLSIIAGKTLGYFTQQLGHATRVVRAMPNMPAMIGKGMTALVANHHVDEHARMYATKLMQAVGEVVWLDDEAQMDVVTAISGSGPAYFFHFMACMVEAAVQRGLSPEVAEKLVRQTALGASHLAKESNSGLCDLITNVASKGGTTEAALSVFDERNALEKLVQDAVTAAIKRSYDLA